jgi:uncharacterized damage-inducible protein DinB
MTYGGKDLAAAFKTVRDNTIKIATEIPEDRYDFKASADTRSVRDLLVHIALSTLFPDWVHRAGVTDMKTLNFQELMGTMQVEQGKPRTKAEIVALLQTRGDDFVSYLGGLSDGFLAQSVTMMPGGEPPTKSRFEMLLGAKEHEMHHRGQLMLIERMVGIVPHLTRQMEERWARMQAQATATK